MHTFFVLNKKTIIAIICGLLILTSVIIYFTAIRPAYQPRLEHCIVIDAGHGGRDGGAVGRQTGVSESEINLKYALCLKEVCEGLGMRVVLTRKDENGLYSPFATNFKKSDMEKRSQIISQSGADMVVSLHMNSFPRLSSRGAQVFYGLDNMDGKALAEAVQKRLHDGVEYAKATPKEGDFYILNCTTKPGILIEVGFLSNSDEEGLLISQNYCEKVCQTIAVGILEFYQM